MLDDFRQALRRLLRSPLFTCVAIATLALAIGANTAVFSVVRGVLGKPLPYPESERLVGLWYEAPGAGFDLVNQSSATYFISRDEASAFEDVAAWNDGQAVVTGLDRPEEVKALQVSDGFFPLLRIEPIVGRAFSAEDDRPGSAPTVVLAHGYWQQRFGGDASVLGSTLRIDGKPHEVIGVTGPDQRFLDYEPALYLPFQLDRAEAKMDNFSFQAFARLADGVSLERANAEADALIPVAVETYPEGLTLEMLEEAGFAAKVQPLADEVIGDVGTTLWILLGTVALVLLLAAANVANLFLVRAEARQLELALRTALGAGRRELLRPFLAESLLIGLAGGAAGLALAAAALELLRVLAPRTLPRLHEVGIDFEVVLFTLALALATGVVLGSIAALRQGSIDLALTLKQGMRAGDGRQRHRARNTLVVAQVALALVLLVGCGLMLRSFQQLSRVDPGFSDPANVLTARLLVPSAEVEEPERVHQIFRRVVEQIESLPGVEAVGLSSSLPMTGSNSNNAVWVEDDPTPEGQLPPIRRVKWISPGYLEALGRPLLAGRGLDWNDLENRSRVVVVSEDFARTYWPSAQAAVGKRVRGGTDGIWNEIVGVVGAVYDDGVAEQPVPVVYWPMTGIDPMDGDLRVERRMLLAIRTPRATAAGTLGELQRAVWSVDRNLPVAEPRTLAVVQQRAMARTSFTLVMLSIAAAVALALAAIGIYGVTSYSVAQRTRELGVRLALGAGRDNVRRLVLGQAATLALVGIGAGAAAALALTRLIKSLLFGVGTMDPLTYAAVAVALLALSLLASYLPARRAARTDPMVALRWG